MTSACRCFEISLQKYNKKKKPQKIATPLLLMLLFCDCVATRYSIFESPDTRMA